MYDKKLVKKRKRRMAASITGLVSGLGVGALSIVAFLGRYVGTFTVSLDTGNVRLSLSNDVNFTESTSVLNIDYLPPYHECTYGNILPLENILDNQDTDYLYSANYKTTEDEANKNPSSINFFKYTFFIKNIGEITAKYSFKLNIVQNTGGVSKNEAGREFEAKLDDTLRVAVYENDVGDTVTHNSTVYAKRSATANRDEEDKVTYKEYISIPKSKEDGNNYCYGFAEEFESDTRIASRSVTNFKHGDIKRYTIITWLEGEDPQSDNNYEAPKGATIKLGVEINAYENE